MNKKEGKPLYESDDFEWLAKAVAKNALEQVINPPEFHREVDDGVSRTKIMFYKPRRKGEVTSSGDC